VGLVGIDWLDKVPALSAISQKLPVLIRGLPGAEAGFSANEVAGALILILPLQVVLLATGLRRWPHLAPSDPLAARPRLWLAAQAALLLFAGSLLLLSQSRGAWVGLSVGLLLMLAWNNRRARWLMLGAGALSTMTLLAVGGPATAFSLLARVAVSDIGAKVIQRQTLWYYGLLIIRDFPLTGMGLNVFRRALPVLYPTVPLPAGYDITHVHNHLLQAAINFGLPGLVAYLGLWFGAAYALLATYRATADPWLRSVALGLAAGLAAHFVFGISDVIDFGAKLGIFFWFALALVISLYHLANAAVPSATTMTPRAG
jgi:putative inorganic carbon (hco3(-)) transporter